MTKMQNIKFNVGDAVRILNKDSTFGWDDGMYEFIGTSAVVEEVNTNMDGFDVGVGYRVGDWWWGESALTLANKFNPKPGDKIICNNGEEFICCTLEFLQTTLLNIICNNKPILGYCKEDHSWQNWNSDGSTDGMTDNYYIREVIPKQKEEDVTEDNKEEPKYTVEDVFEAIEGATALATPYSYTKEVKEYLSRKTNVQYQEYLRLKAIYE